MESNFCWKFNKGDNYSPWLRWGYNGQYTHIKREIYSKPNTLKLKFTYLLDKDIGEEILKYLCSDNVNCVA